MRIKTPNTNNYHLPFPWEPIGVQSLTYGKTPLFHLNGSEFHSAHVYAKLEYFNEGQNVKMRVAAAMINRAEALGILRPFSGQTILESSGGSTGVSLAIIAARRGYKVKLVLPDNYSPTRIAQLPKFGATVELSDHTKGNDSHFVLARQLAEQNSDYYFIDQLSNPANFEAHYFGTGLELVEALPKIDYLVCGVGSGGSISGIGKRIKESFPKAKIIAVQPDGCNVLKGDAVPHKFQGWAAGLVPEVFDTNLVDSVITVNYEDAREVGFELVKNYGLFTGISTWGNILACQQLSAEVQNKYIVTLAPDSGHIYPDHFNN